MSDLATVIENDIPEGRKHLQDSHTNLERVAEYCEANYFQCEGKKAALEETKNYTTQSLASVAYQINTLAYNMLHMLDLQLNQLSDMESHVNHISQTVMIHKEKVARREIGVLTTNKSTSRQHKILAPANPERPIKYIRKPIDYSVLDDIGHGVRALSNTPRTKRLPSISGIPPGVVQQVVASPAASSGPAPTTKPPTPPQPLRSGGSLSRSNREYRTPAPPIAPPQVPSNYAPNYPIGHPKSNIHDRGNRGPGYSHLPVVSQQNQPTYGTHQLQQPPLQIGRVHPIQQTQQHIITTSSAVPPPSPNPNNLPPPPPIESMPEPPPPPPMPSAGCQGGEFERPGNVTPPLPPPPPMQDHDSYMLQSQQFLPPCPPNAEYNPVLETSQNHEVSLIPKSYIEKVVAIYDYNADKDDELSFQENSVIYVLKKNDDGWYEGMLGGITGLFPGNYVEACMQSNPHPLYR